ncbi:DUF4214 domain-containing protein [Pseudoduganella danionis]|uniref:DUF4214 domain-containing protein n=1 Tax=Pseudoduganella danionis TaxID=1890295 RepID=A0ABW9SNC2_9BURK|nr:DUF4214 domain-containing protein [Pseudoduganella danionis]MTW33079.1 DUF4214 domain-containing protein [Pseudoduganella danionis]
MKLRYFVAVCSVLAGCGGAPSSDVQNSSVSIQQGKSGGRVVLGDATQTNPAPTGTVTIAGYRSNFTIVKDQVSSAVTVTNNITKAVQTYNNPQLIKFVDTYTSFDVNGAAGQVYRLYQAAFNRKPDLPGLGFWIAANQKGIDLLGIATHFIGSPEFGNLYGTNVSNNSFISTLYQNILNRAGESGGVTWWVGQLNSGVPKNAALYGFSDSAENKNNLQAEMQNGFDYVPLNPSGPILPKASSYENKIAAAAALGSQNMPPEVAESNTVAFADFFQDGSYSMVTHSLEYNYTAATATKFGHIKFYKKVDGLWVDNTAKLLKDNLGCLHPRKAIVADFNGDGKPDVFFACHGFDAGNYPGEQPHMLISQTDGTYRNVTLPDTCYCHSASAADVNRNGFADILVTDNMVGKKPFFFTNKNGVLSRDTSRFGVIYSQPNDGSNGIPGVSYGTPAIYTAELIDFYGSGRYDAFLGGTAPDNVWGDWAPAIFKNDGSGVYTQANSIQLPYSKYYESTLDIVIDGGFIYLTSVHENNDPKTETYGFSNIVKIDLQSLVSTQIYANTENFPNGHGWLNWIIPYQGQIVSQSAAYGVSVSK